MSDHGGSARMTPSAHNDGGSGSTIKKVSNKDKIKNFFKKTIGDKKN